MRGWEINPSFHWILMILSHKQNSLIHFSQTRSEHSDSAVPQSTSVSVPWCIFPPQDFRGACPHQKMQVRQTTESTGENLSYLKYETYNLPTAIVSNTLDYGKFDILDTTQYMKNTLGVWKALDFQGILLSVESGYRLAIAHRRAGRVTKAQQSAKVTPGKREYSVTCSSDTVFLSIPHF